MAKNVKSSPVWNLTKSDARSNLAAIKRPTRMSRSPSAVDILRKFVTHISGWYIILLLYYFNGRTSAVGSSTKPSLHKFA